MSTSSEGGEPFQLVDIANTGAVISSDVRRRCDAVADIVSSDEKLEYLPDPVTSMYTISDMTSRHSYDTSVHTDVRRDATTLGYLGDDDTISEDSITRYARVILTTLKYAAPVIGYAPPTTQIRDEFLTQLIIDSHVAVVNEIIHLGQIDPSPRNIITYVCGSFAQPGVSPLSGLPWITLNYSDQVMSALAVARIVVATLWSDYDDMVYTECHRQLDKQALFHIQATYRQRRRASGCCIAM